MVRILKRIRLEKKTHWERYRMVQDGSLRSDSARGYWELNEDRR